jgi:hypothetical protein
MQFATNPHDPRINFDCGNRRDIETTGGGGIIARTGATNQY